MALDSAFGIEPPQVLEDGDGEEIYCPRCDEEDCEWFGICPHTPEIWLALNPASEMARARRAQTKEASK